MADAKIMVVDNGPFYVAGGSVEVVDPDGKSFALGDQVALCRCGKSTNQPFCTGTHKEGFASCVRAK